jgi:hypothetical protein
MTAAAPVSSGMDWLQFVATVIGHLAWPSVVIVLLIVLRRHLGSLAERMEEFSFGGAKVVWKKKLVEGAEIIELTPRPALTKDEKQASPKLESPPADDQVLRNRRFFRWSQFTSTLTAMKAMADVDGLLFEIAEKMQMKEPDPHAVLWDLAATKRVPLSTVQLYETLRDARNAILHSSTQPSHSELQEYLRQTAYLTKVLRKVRDEIPGPTGQ